MSGRAVGALHDAFRQFDSTPSAEVAVLHGRHGSFCAGADLKELAQRRTYEAWAGSVSGMLGAPLGKPMIVLHDPALTHALKEVDAAAMAVAESPAQVVQLLNYAINGSLDQVA